MSSLSQRTSVPSLHAPRPFHEASHGKSLSATQSHGHGRNNVSVSSTPQHGSSSHIGLFSKQSLLILTIGIMFGYILLPMLLVQHLGFADLPITGQESVYIKPTDISMYGTHALGSTNGKPTAMQPQSEIHTPTSRTLSNDPIRIDATTTATATNKLRKKNEPLSNAEGSEALEISTTHLEQNNFVEGGLALNNNNQHKILRSGDSKIVLGSDFNHIVKRIMEDRDILSRQSIPTATSPDIMMTERLPDHQRKKILVTGGAGFVGSHLVDKLMMEGHEVIVVDNFFTGQKKNVAHWFHHPYFRYVPRLLSLGCSLCVPGPVLVFNWTTLTP